MGTIQIKKVEKTVTTGKQGEERQKVKKTYGKIIYRGTLSLYDMAEHIMKHGTVYTEDVVIGVITKLKSCIQEMLSDGYKVKLDGIGTLYPVPGRPEQEVAVQGFGHEAGHPAEHAAVERIDWRRDINQQCTQQWWQHHGW